MPNTDFVDNLVAACNIELTRFENGARTERQSPQYRYVGEYWSSIAIDLNGRTKVDGIRPAWSSAFVSFVVRKAGAGNRFEYSQAHCHYTAKAMALSEGVANMHGYRAHRQGNYSPKLGDILISGREEASRYGYNQAKLTYTADSFFPSHGDVVVKINPNSVETIGGNVARDTVGRRIRKINTSGRLLDRRIRGEDYPWVTVLECLL